MFTFPSLVSSLLLEEEHSTFKMSWPSGVLSLALRFCVGHLGITNILYTVQQAEWALLIILNCLLPLLQGDNSACLAFPGGRGASQFMPVF
jgi:hypothetical protein